MTVKQLIELLQALPQDLPVYLRDWNEGYEPDVEIDATDEKDVSDLLPRVEEAYVRPPRWDLPRRVVIG